MRELFFSKTLNYFFSTPPRENATASAKEGIKRERNDETFLRFVVARVEAYLYP